MQRLPSTSFEAEFKSQLNKFAAKKSLQLMVRANVPESLIVAMLEVYCSKTPTTRFIARRRRRSARLNAVAARIQRDASELQQLNSDPHIFAEMGRYGTGYDFWLPDKMRAGAASLLGLSLELKKRNERREPAQALALLSSIVLSMTGSSHWEELADLVNVGLAAAGRVKPCKTADDIRRTVRRSQSRKP
jgi:hypothetical protein